jgi:hypothetical protein
VTPRLGAARAAFSRGSSARKSTAVAATVTATPTITYAVNDMPTACAACVSTVSRPNETAHHTRTRRARTDGRAGAS